MHVEILDNTDVEPYCSAGEVLKVVQIYTEMDSLLLSGQEIHFIIPKSQVKEITENEN